MTAPAGAANSAPSGRVTGAGNPTGTAGAGWSVEPAPPVYGQQDALSADSCPAATACVAVGSYDDGSQVVPLSEVWNGTSWTVRSAGIPPGPGQFDAVSCSSGRACMAVGFSQSATANVALAASWNGNRWTLRALAEPVGMQTSALEGVSCDSGGDCTAVGTYSSAAGQLTLVEDWNGTTWHLQPSPNEPGVYTSRLTGVSCSSPMACAAVGFYFGVGNNLPSTLGEIWNGTSWRLQTTPNATAAVAGSTLEKVSCSSPDACVAVGFYRTASGVSTPSATLAEAWNGTSWAIQDTPDPVGNSDSQFDDVSCSSATSCTAIGWYYNRSFIASTLAEGWNGRSWSIEASPNAGAMALPGAGSQLNGVSCASAVSCIAVGDSTTQRGSDETLAEIGNSDTWSVQTTPSPRRAVGNFLTAVSCRAVSACAAVGVYYPPASLFVSYVALAETWDGAGWDVEHPPIPAGTDDSLLTAVSCSSSTACTAIGSAENDGNTNDAYPFADQWDGTAWHFRSIPLPVGASAGFLNAVSCTSPGACVAVGYSVDAAGYSTLVETWNGSTWQLQTSPSVGSVSTLTGVSCSSVTFCFAVGSTNGDQLGSLLAEEWDGTSWSVRTVPDPGQSGIADLAAISCTSSFDCTAVGSAEGSGIEVPLAERWNGTAWQVQTTPGPDEGSFIRLLGVSCSSTTDCVAVGSYESSTGPTDTLTETWNGSAWLISMSPPLPGSTASFLDGVSCLAPTTCLSAGAVDADSSARHALLETNN